MTLQQNAQKDQYTSRVLVDKDNMKTGKLIQNQHSSRESFQHMGPGPGSDMPPQVKTENRCGLLGTMSAPVWTHSIGVLC